MKITIVSKGAVIYEIKRLAEELERRGHSVSVANPLFTLDDIVRDSWWNDFLSTDVLYYRTGLGDAPRTELTKRLAGTTIRCINRLAIDNHLLSNKVYQALQVKALGTISVPTTYFGRGHLYKDLLLNLGERFVLKAAQGIQGKKVSLISSEADYVSQVEQLSGDILLQKFIPNTGDYRVFVVGGKTRAIFKRVPKVGDFRANMSQGGHGETVQDEALYAQLSRYGEMVAAAIGLDIAGIDLMQHTETGEIFFIESNVNPGWKGLDETLGTNMAATIASFVLGEL